MASSPEKEHQNTPVQDSPTEVHEASADIVSVELPAPQGWKKKAGALPAVPSSTNGASVHSAVAPQQSSKPLAPPAPTVGSTGYHSLRSPAILASGPQLQPQASAASPLVGSSVPSTSHLQWLSSGVGPTAPAPSTPVPPASASTSSQFTYTNVSYPPGPTHVPSSSVTATSAAPYFPLPFHLQQQSDILQQQQQPEQQYHQQQQYVMPQYQPQVQKQYVSAPQPQQPAVVQASQYQYSSLYQASVSVGGVYSLPQQQQAQQLFQKDAQTITPEALESVKAALASSESEHKAETKKKAIPRKAAGQTWEDPTLADWPENDYRLFCGDLGNEVNDEVLTKAFSRFACFNMARVVRDKRTGKTRGYGFVSFSSPSDLALALKEMNGKYVGNRPIKLRKSNWKERTDYEAWEKQKIQNHKKGKSSRKNVLHK